MKTVVVASGKGGTGKTTLTALFALLAHEHTSIVLADADVEASNLPIALAAHDASCTAFEGGQVAVVSRERCIDCGVCAQVCRFDAVQQPRYGDMTTRHVIDPWACEGCGACARSCSRSAITMQPKTAGEACTAQARTGAIAYGQLGPGEDLSGRLVTEVRERAKQAAEEARADLLLIDGPPGVGCPVISAITNTDLLVAVTEPTVSGEHDVDRLARLARRLDVPVAIVLNKADLSIEGAERIRAFCVREDLPLLAEIPFDRDLAGLLPALASGGRVDDASPGLAAARSAWQAVEERISS